MEKPGVSRGEQEGVGDVDTKNVTIVEGGVFGRIYVPKSVNSTRKLPLLVFYHGGSFIYNRAFSPFYDNYISAFVRKANIVAFSVDYKYYIPTAYEDSWLALKWVASHASGHGPEAWLNSLADFERVYVAGDSAGANIAHNLLMKQQQQEDVVNIKVKGMALLHPYFWGSTLIGNETGLDVSSRSYASHIWLDAIRKPELWGTNLGNKLLDDPRVNPLMDSRLSSLPCGKVLVVVGDEDIFKDRGLVYYDALRKNGWTGEPKLLMTEGTHCFFLTEIDSTPLSKVIFEHLSSFINGVLI
ncbi:2-hydroxyisoflavanone dehydratase-like [Diospyros lotus]|uniref:2-hydroxyisoflavanone dehydratase-like n=1 Tax=Diospyros lotus TaxID=55363 RepID=UPI002258C059|nr:2-hydroxyisoflavanone dehydratase-like [Diospyros lotus]XP_052203059.1 2-hydroxyisoflavanone dehydratase-like [Diospyros lotus]